MINISSNRSDNKCLITSQEVDNLQKSLNPSYVCIFTRNMIVYMQQHGHFKGTFNIHCIHICMEKLEKNTIAFLKFF